MLLGDQKDIQIRPGRPADIGEQEVDGIERQRVETTILAHPHHSHSNSVPIVSVMTVIGALSTTWCPQLQATLWDFGTIHPQLDAEWDRSYESPGFDFQRVQQLSDWRYRTCI